MGGRGDSQVEAERTQAVATNAHAGKGGAAA